MHCTVNKPGGLSSDEFRRILKRGTQRQKRGPQSPLPSMTVLAEQMFRDCPALPQGLSAYNIETHLPLIQETYNRLYPGKYRIIAFDNYGRYKPIFKGPPAEMDVCIVHHGSETDGTAHFDGVRCVNSLFGKSFYCPECEIAFYTKIDHTSRCVRRCNGCGGMGSNFPCRGGLAIECSNCNTKFVSRECYDRHLSAMCSRYQTCPDCGIKYNTASVKRSSADKQHVCGTKFCARCCCYHKTEQPCFIQPVEPKDDEKPCRFVAYDFESSQHTQPDPDKEHFLHEVFLPTPNKENFLLGKFCERPSHLH